MATREEGKPTTGTDPITDLTGGSGGTGQERPHLGRDDLASASKVLFGDAAEGKQTQGTPKSFLQYDTEEEALEAALAEAKAAEEPEEGAGNQDEAATVEEDGKPAGEATDSESGDDGENFLFLYCILVKNLI